MSQHIDPTPKQTDITTLNSNLSNVLTNTDLRSFAKNVRDGFTCFRYNNTVTNTPVQYGHGYIVKYGVNIRIVVFAMQLDETYTSYSYNSGTSWTNWDSYALNSNIGKVVENGSVTQGHIYCIHFVESTIANASFEILYNPNENEGIQNFSVCLTNGTSIFCCTAKISLSNGQLSVSEAYRIDTGTPGEQAWNVTIRTIRMIA